MSACRCRRKRTVEKQKQLQRKEAFDLVGIVGIKCYSKERLYRECHEGKQKTLNEGLSRITNVCNTEQTDMACTGLCLDDRAKHTNKSTEMKFTTEMKFKK